jgi:hypothetical protein
MGFWSTLAGIGGAIAAPFTGGASLIPTIAGAAGAGLGALSQGMAQNRGQQYGGQLDLERLLMDRDQSYFNQRIQREQEGRAGQSDAFRKLLATSHLLSPGPRPQLSPYSVASRMPTGAEQTGGNALLQQVLARLQGGNPIAPVTERPMSVDPKLLKAGGLEKLFGYGSAGLGILGALKPRQQAGSGAVMY